MEDIRNILLSKYGIDIAQENIFILYGIDSVDISRSGLEKKIHETHERWDRGADGPDERIAVPDRAYQERADSYEAVLRDPVLRRQVFDYYCGSAREYFKLVAMTKRLNKTDVEFFFRYFRSERKNKKVILEMLDRDLKIHGLGKAEQYKDDEPGPEEKNDDGPLVVNLFREDTVIQIRRALEKFEEAAGNDEVCRMYPAVREGFDRFIGIDGIRDADQFAERMSAGRLAMYSERQKNGAGFAPLVEMFSILRSLGDRRDVADNIPEIKLLIRYPDLTPYMFSFAEMTGAALKGIAAIARREYAFRSEADFIMNYYLPVCDNFGISDTGIGGLILKAQREAKRNRRPDVSGRVSETDGAPLTDVAPTDGRGKLTPGAETLRRPLYWPVYAAYFVFEVLKFIFTKLRLLAVPVFAALLVWENMLAPKLGLDDLSVLLRIFDRDQWLSYMYGFFSPAGTAGVMAVRNPAEVVIASLVLIIIFLAGYAVIPLFGALFVSEFAADFNKQFDWGGIERTFRQILWNEDSQRHENIAGDAFAGTMEYNHNTLKRTVLEKNNDRKY